MFRSILVLESPWDPKSVRSKSVWPFASEFANAVGLDAYHQMFVDKASFHHWVRRYHAAKSPGPKLLYVAAHGSDGRIAGLRRSINGGTIAESLRLARSIEYVHFGSCFFGSADNLDGLLASARHLKWAAGYDKAVDWVDSTLFDIMLWGRIAARDPKDRFTKGKKTHTLTENLLGQTKGLAQDLGFRFHYRYGKNVWRMDAT
jgi:hypothetical protein